VAFATVTVNVPSWPGVNTSWFGFFGVTAETVMLTWVSR
jgi:hypothetical protein